MQEKNARIKSTLSSIIENSCLQSGQLLSSQYWKQLFEELSEGDDLKLKTSYLRGREFDLSTVTFIYHEMKNSCDYRVKDFFKRVWYNCTKSSSTFYFEIEIGTVKLKLAPLVKEKRINHFKKLARKVYQIQFLKLLLKQHTSFDSLIEDYKLLKVEFMDDIIDFRLRLLNQYEFEELIYALNRIYELIERTEKTKRTEEELSLIKYFHEELNYFLSYKCLIFTRDFYATVIGKKYFHSFIGLYQPVFETFKKISTLFSSIHAAFHSKKNPVHSSELGCKIVGVSDDVLLLDEIFTQFLELTKLSVEKKTYEIYVELYEIGKKIGHAQYLDTNLSLIVQNATRFQYVEAIGEIKKMISERNEWKLEEIFYSPKYSFLRELWKPCRIAACNKSIEIKMEFLEYFYSFLILHHQ